MKLVSYHSGAGWQPGLLHGDHVFGLNTALRAAGLAASADLPSTRAFLQAHGSRLPSIAAALDPVLDGGAIEPVGDVATVRLGPPVTDPLKVLCVGLNYSDHVGETGRAMPSHPDLFAKFASSLIGPYDAIDRSDVTDNLDFEGELAVVIGKACSRVDESDALSYVAGLSVLNDITARDLQYRGTQWLAGKAVDRATPFGPAIVTLEEIGNPQALDIETFVNGTRVQGSNTKYMIFSVAKIISYVSQFLTLSPGDVIATGTPEGIGAKRNPPMWLRPGDKVEVVLEKVGTLSNQIH
ncbi:fumarylacetoacetate hydrolase family protein [Streptomyces sp. DSM 40750]|uniref:fumarylacetoacetate hydrolase family protein n=1 Tax=Streptomyces sp. DSM 40750 TaxID=2801030 RepID=UPI00214B2F61|nr:fumarylacetoacetate hydrolase family protein [Streptomyces sp. DSM 40750]UUU19122.1 fumarylacetoacetate hydrolase family protein [Streptomyces sp. DSM 40750]UUU27534.1 fumarylacetoacetate hydrolase family protein [Streptomyces sp. DSM 40750]